MVFPEGTRNPEPKMLPFKKGAFHMAVDCQAPVVPVVLSNYKSFFCCEDKIFNDVCHLILYAGVIKLTVLPVVSTDGLTLRDVSDLTKRVQSMMQDELDQQRDEVEATRQVVPLAADSQRAVVTHFTSSASNESAQATKEGPGSARRSSRFERSV
ncbi:hypothetical protein MRX96_034912 [Rhipicephalus microplus]